MNRSQIQTTQLFDAFKKRERERGAPIQAVLGDGHSHVLVGTAGVYVYARIDGDSRQIVRVRGVDPTQQQDNTPILVELVPGDGKSVYRYLGKNDKRQYSSDSLSGTIALHAPQHERADYGSGGYDPLEVFNRALTETRGQAQAVPNFTVYVTPGPYKMQGVWQYWLGGSSGAIAVPVDEQMTLIYFDAALTIQLLAGADMAGPPTPPTVPTSSCFPICWVWMTSLTASITEAEIANAKIIGDEVGGFGAVGAAGGDLAGTYPNPTVKQSSTEFALTADITPAQITASQDDYNPAGLSTASTLRLDTDATWNLTGLQGGADGRIILIHNIGVNSLVLKHEDGASAVGNRFFLAGGTDVTLTSDLSILLQYDNTLSRWRLIGGTGGGGEGFLYTVSFGDASPTTVFTLPAGQALDRLSVYVNDLWDGVGAEIEIQDLFGTILFSTTDTFLTDYVAFDKKVEQVIGGVNVFITPGAGATTGQVQVQGSTTAN